MSTKIHVDMTASRPKAGFPSGFLKTKKRTSSAGSLVLIMHPETFPRLTEYMLVLSVPGLYPSGGHSSCDPFVHCVPLLFIGMIYLFSYLGVNLSLLPLSLHGFSLCFNILYFPYLGCVGSWPAVRTWHPFIPAPAVPSGAPIPKPSIPSPVILLSTLFLNISTKWPCEFILYHNTTLCIPSFLYSLLCEHGKLHEHLIYLSFHISNN